MAHQRDIPVVVDNTFMSSYFQQPLSLGADIVMHSTTKYMNGHSDSIGGALMLNDEEIHEKIEFTQNAAGAILSPFESFLILRGLKTLAVRMREHEKNALKIAAYLEKHPRVRKINYPGLKSHPQHKLAASQMSGFGGMLSFEIDGDLAAAKIFVESVRIFALAESLGGVESLIELPALMTHASVPAEERKKIGLSDTLIRLSVGIENGDDLLEDLENAFRNI
jgi:cystathionine gamma-lyase